MWERGGRTLFLASLSAPRSNSKISAFKSRLSAARCNGVLPFCARAAKAQKPHSRQGTRQHRRRPAPSPRAQQRAASTVAKATWTGTHVVFRLRVCAAIQQQNHNGPLVPAVLCGMVQRRHAVLRALHAGNHNSETADASAHFNGERSVAADKGGPHSQSRATPAAAARHRRAQQRTANMSLCGGSGRVGRRTLSLVSKFAPRSNNKVTTDEWPPMVAT